ncbi:MAG: UDP-N-acetylglucosamine 1-carboxyvinyltransferase [Ruminococcaceae bacterium]|nr:UDP-N-acetylglucosamine 1-carboxyvinyltransferase [Oscillospiraceae bacterium]
MKHYKITGGNLLSGEISVHGSKNAALPILAATVINNGKSIIHNCPNLSDVRNMLEILNLLGCRAEFVGRDVIVDSSGFSPKDIPYDIMKQTRSSSLFAGALLARGKRALISGSGGCCIGRRPIDLHLRAFGEMGADIIPTGDGILCVADCLRGSKIILDFPSVGATENIMIAASLTPSTTVIYNAAKEPEIVNLADYLRSVGVIIKGDGTGEIHIKGTCTPKDGEVEVVGDRIVAATYLTAVACSGGSIKIKSIDPGHLSSVIASYRKMGMSIGVDGDEIEVSRQTRLVNLPNIITSPYPGFPTDCQPLIVAAMTTSYGIGIVNERIFENRLGHCERLRRMGANIETTGRCAVVRGVYSLSGADVSSCDLRCGAALVCAALGAKGESVVSNISYIDRGYENLCDSLKILGAKIERIELNE